MASESTTLRLLEKALWSRRETSSDWEEQQLAFALGYPDGFRVRRRLEDDLLVDRIYAGEPSTGPATWFHHAAARKAVADGWDESLTYSNGHLLPRKAKFEIGDKVEVFYDKKYYQAKILRRKEYPDGYKYQVHYLQDSSKQSAVPENLIRHLHDKDPRQVAQELGLDREWMAVDIGRNRWKITAPNGTVYTSKKKALENYEQQQLQASRNNNDGTSTTTPMQEGDPPWRTTGNDLLGKRVHCTARHPVSARRTIAVEQTGIVQGWISEHDVDTAGQPGYISELTGKPARLYHVVFDHAPAHPYASYLVDSQDFEESELKDCLVDKNDFKEPDDAEQEQEPVTKKQKTA